MKFGLRTMKIGLVMLLVFSIPAFGSGQIEKSKTDLIQLKMGHVYEPSHPMHVGMIKAAENLEKISEGKMRIEIFPASQLGKETALAEQVNIGGIDMAIIGGVFASNDYPQFPKVLTLET